MAHYHQSALKGRRNCEQGAASRGGRLPASLRDSESCRRHLLRLKPQALFLRPPWGSPRPTPLWSTQREAGWRPLRSGLRAAQLPLSLALNYSEFPNSCRGVELLLVEEVTQVLVDRGNGDLVQLRQKTLREPDGPAVEAHLNATPPVLSPFGPASLGACQNQFTGNLVYPGADYLLAYWMGRYHGFLTAED